MARGIDRSVVMCLLMLAAAGLSIAARPTHRLADRGPRIDLERLTPQSFGGWRVDRSIVPISVAPDVQARLDKIYNQTLARTYVDGSGRRVMLSIAYGGDQSDAMQIHRPEVCYTAQGFQVVRQALAKLATKYGPLSVKRLVAQRGARYEPITYWIVIGEEVTQGGFDQKLAQLKYGLTGGVPDGMLVRVSTIDRDESRAYALEDGFIAGLLGAMSQQDRKRVLGRLGT